MTNGRRSRILRKAEKAAKNDVEREFDRQFGALFAEMQVAYRRAALDLDAAVRAAKDDHVKAKRAADERFQEQRAKLLERLGKKERAAA